MTEFSLMPIIGVIYLPANVSEEHRQDFISMTRNGTFDALRAEFPWQGCPYTVDNFFFTIVEVEAPPAVLVDFIFPRVPEFTPDMRWAIANRAVFYAGQFSWRDPKIPSFVFSRDAQDDKVLSYDKPFRLNLRLPGAAKPKAA